MYKEGKENIEADTLSRNPVLESFKSNENCLKMVNMVELNEIINDQQAIKKKMEKEKHISIEGGISYKFVRNKKIIYVSAKFGLKLILKVHNIMVILVEIK